MEVIRSQHGPVVILTIHGAVTEDVLEPLVQKWRECVDNGLVKVVLDLRQVPFIDSAGLERLSDFISELGKRGGDLRLAGLNDICRDILKATRISNLIQIADDRDAAVRSLL